MTGRKLDCVVVGYNDVDLGFVDTKIKPTRDRLGTYSYFEAQTVVLDGKRLHFTDLLNTARKAAGKQDYIHVAQTPNLACCIIKSFLESRGLSVGIVNFFNRDKDLFRAMLEDSPRAVAVSTTVYTDQRPIVEIVQFIRSVNPDVKIIVGGPHIYNVCADYDEATQDFLFSEVGADVYVHDSQGELTLSRAVTALRDGDDLSKVPNLNYTSDGGATFQRTAREAETNDLNANVIDWSLFDDSYLQPSVWMRTARSCAFHCAFCRYPSLGGPLVLNDMDVLQAQFRTLADRGVEFIYFIDDTFNVPLPRFKKLCKMMIENKFGFRWASYFRCGNADNETFDLMREAGCTAVFAGVESGAQSVLNNMLKAAKVEMMQRGIENLEKRGVLVYASCIIGFPGETHDTVTETINFIDHVKPSFYSAEFYFHDPKAPAQERAEEFGLTGNRFNWKHSTMDWRQAAQEVHRVHASIQNSEFLPLYGADMWSIPHFLHNGISVDQLKQYLRLARSMVVRGFDTDTPDHSADFQRMVQVFQ
jgi:radical SAM PhpK family P-methyltransferase